jgi:biotin carboxylase
MRNVIFAAPFQLDATYRFVRAAAGLSNERMLGLVAQAPRGADAGLFADFEIVSDPLDTGQLVDAAHKLAARHGPIHRVLGILEPLQVQLAHVRQALGVAGTSPEVADLFRDKGRMKDELRRHGLPCARHAVITCAADAADFVARVGFPIVIKPPAGQGCKSTWRITDAEQLQQALQAIRASPERPAIAEEFLRGREFSFETITIGGEVRFASLSRYFPTPLEVMENPWVQWVVVLPRDISGGEYADAHELGIRTVKALGLETGFTHMEWFRRDDGSLAIGEIAARPPGAQIVVCNNYAHDADFHRAWARAVVDEAFDGPFERKYAVGIAFLRGIGRGHVIRLSGLDAANQRVGHLVVESRLPKIGTPRADTYEGDGHVIVRHPDVEVVKAAMQVIIESIRIEYA